MIPWGFEALENLGSCKEDVTLVLILATIIASLLTVFICAMLYIRDQHKFLKDLRTSLEKLGQEHPDYRLGNIIDLNDDEEKEKKG